MRSKIEPILEEARRDRTVYVEPFGGSAAMLLALEPVKHEVYNDADGRLADFFRALADDEAHKKMKRYAAVFPKSREIYDEMKRDWVKSPQLAKRGFAAFYVQTFSFGGKPFNSFGVERRGGSDKLVGTYLSKSERLDEYAARFRFTTVESLDWKQCVAKYDSEQAFFYLDPPYCGKQYNFYRRDLPPVDHAELVETLLSVRGGAALSCYSNDVYVPLERAGWKRFDFETTSSVKRSTDNIGEQRRRIETLYVSPMQEKNKAKG
ncbi:MAG: DNA adenine methylase [Thermoguttaceae bacterium]|nr:DNA adenine methylase [Thermoguttaceae bacterium]